MLKRLQEVLELKLDPELREELGDQGSEVDNLKAISKTLRSNGGKLMINAILLDAKETLSTVLEQYKTMPEIELRANIAELGVILRFYSTIRDAENDATDAESVLISRLDELLE